MSDVPRPLVVARMVCRAAGALTLVYGLAAALDAARDASASVAAPERWTCEIDLHQGDVGRLEFDRTEAGVAGTLTVRRAPSGPAQTTAIKGSWGRDVIRFTRTLSSTSEQPFVGIAAGAEGQVMKMAGRFAFGFDGVWSATCSRGEAGGGRGETGSGRPANAESAPPVAPPPGPCTISVTAAGPRADVARVFALVVRGPDSFTAVRARQPFGSGRADFTGLPPGRYLVTLDTKADVAVGITPRRHEVACSSGATIRTTFEFR